MRTVPHGNDILSGRHLRPRAASTVELQWGSGKGRAGKPEKCKRGNVCKPAGCHAHSQQLCWRSSPFEHTGRLQPSCAQSSQLRETWVPLKNTHKGAMSAGIQRMSPLGGPSSQILKKHIPLGQNGAPVIENLILCKWQEKWPFVGDSEWTRAEGELTTSLSTSLEELTYCPAARRQKSSPL